MEIVRHPLNPIFDSESHTLLLGTMPSPKSREAGYYYAHPQNRFWPVLAAVYGEAAPRDDAARRALILGHHLALWDVLARCEIRGASDASIRGAVANDIVSLIEQSAVSRVFCTGQSAGRYYRRLVENKTGIACGVLPSTSPANCRVPFDELVKCYSAALL
jgi:hypoxanthine-DNA glycosylase